MCLTVRLRELQIAAEVHTTLRTGMHVQNVRLARMHSNYGFRSKPNTEADGYSCHYLPKISGSRLIRAPLCWKMARTCPSPAAASAVRDC